MSRLWRPGLLVLLLVGPILAYIGFGMLWLQERGWLLMAGVIWLATGVVFSILAARWTKNQSHILPPIDWERPETFSKMDDDAWKMVESEADRGETISLEQLTEFDTYVDVGRRLAKGLAEHYHPLSADPIQLLPIVDLLTAIELASEDLGQLCRQVPGGDMITPEHWKKAVQVAGYLQKANDIYSYLLPIFSPMTGLARLGSQHLMVKPAWKNMQQNLLRWFFRAYVNRLGTHLIELYSGRLAIGTAQYRRLTRRGSMANPSETAEKPRLKIGLAGVRGSGKSRLLSTVQAAMSKELVLLKARMEGEGIDPLAFEAVETAEWIEIPGYTVNTSSDAETARDRATRRESVETAVNADLLILVSDAHRNTSAADTSFAQAWDRWFIEHPAAELPPALAVLTFVDHPNLGGDWRPPYHWEKGESPREVAVRSKINALRAGLPPNFGGVVPVSLGESSQYGLVEFFFPLLLSQIQKAERAALIRHFNAVAGRSKAGRLIRQVGAQGRSLWKTFQNARAARHRSTTSAD